MKISSGILAASLLLSSTPALAVNANTSDPCTQANITDRLSCQRIIRESQAMKKSTTRDYIRLNSEIIQKVRSNRRSDELNNAGSTAAKLKAKAEALNKLEIRRAKTEERIQARIKAAEERNSEHTDKAMSLLRKQIEATSTKIEVFNKTQVRAEIRNIDETTQRRRNAVENARSICKDEKGADKLACIKKHRNLLLEAQEQE